MSGSVKFHKSPLIDEFFKGVDELREYLDRRLQDPQRRRQRLSSVAIELLHPRAPRELGRWLLAELGDALGANAGELLMREPNRAELVSWHKIGAASVSQMAPSVTELTQHLHHSPTIVTLPGEITVVPLHGLNGPVGAFWLSLCTPLDAESMNLMTEIASTVGAALEQGLLLAAMSC